MKKGMGIIRSSETDCVTYKLIRVTIVQLIRNRKQFFSPFICHWLMGCIVCGGIYGRMGMCVRF